MKDDRTWRGIVPWIYEKCTSFRKNRFSRFLIELSPKEGEKIIDLGGEPEFWRTAKISVDVHCINLDKIEFDDSEYLVQLRTSSGDCCELSNEQDNSYDLVFSNSVIEHVGDFDRQKKFADTALRLGKKIWIQTPAKCFPIEPHWFALFIHWFPRKYQYLLFRLFALRQRFARVKLTKSEVKAQVDDVRLMTKGELKKIFPDCKIITERFLFIPKSYVVMRRGDQ